MQIIPAILEKDFLKAESKIRELIGLSKWAQIDTIDGKFSPGKSFELELMNSLRLEGEEFLWEIHLIVSEPKNWIEKCDFIGASRIVGHVEMMKNRELFVEKVKNKGIEVGLAFDFETKIENIPQETDMVVLLGRKAGFKEEVFNDEIFEKIEKLKKIRKEKGLNFKIGLDGGINKEKIKKVKEAGVDIAYCGAAIFNGIVKSNLEELKKIII